MTWNDELERRLTDLRLRELSGALTEPEQKELDEMIQMLDLAEVQALTESIEQWQSERDQLQAQVRQVERDNDDLLRLLIQQEKLATDARRWLSEFERRHASLQDNYKRLVGETTE
jgi:hypothetical protein